VLGSSQQQASGYSGKVLDKRSEDRKTGVAVGHEGERGGECEEDILPVGDKFEETVDLEKYHKIF